DFSSKLQFHTFTNNIISDQNNIKLRIPHAADVVVVKWDSVKIDVARLRNLVAQLPIEAQRLFRFDNISLNAHWRRQMLMELIEQEMWLVKSHQAGLQRSTEYLRLKLHNEQNMLIKSFLNSLRTLNQDSINSKLAAIVNDSK